MKRNYRGLILVLLLLSALPGASVQAELRQDITNTASDGRVIVFFGDSLTAGYRLDPAQAYPAVIQSKIIARGWNFRVVNAGVSGETTAGGLRRVDWVLQRPLDVFVLELGANDGLRGLPVDVAIENLQAIIDRVKAKYPHAKVVLAGMKIPPSLGHDYTTRFSEIFAVLARHNRIPLIPFLLEGVGGVPDLNLPDGIHPTPEGHRIVAENVWKVLEPVLRAMQ